MKNNQITRTKKDLTRPNTITSWEYNYDHHRGKILNLIDWIKTNIVNQPGNFLSVKDLYYKYKIENLPQALVTEDLFYKELEPILFGLNFNPGKIRCKSRRGYIGIGIVEETGVKD